MNDSKKLVEEFCSVLDMWYDWSVMYPMSMTAEEFIEAMSNHFSNYRHDLANRGESLLQH